MKCFIITPTVDSKDVRSFLDRRGISYSHDDGIIFGNLSEIPEGLEEIATVDDPVFCENDKWYFRCLGNIEGPHDTEHKARTHFVQYISWSGEFVNNSK